MAKRFAETKIWEDEWFQSLPLDWKLAWKYLCDKCDEAGIWKPNFRLADFQIGKQIQWEQTDQYLNNGKERIRITDSAWIINDFVLFQYGEKVLSSDHPFHKKIRFLLSRYPIDTLCNRVQVMVKEKVKSTILSGSLINISKIEKKSNMINHGEKSEESGKNQHPYFADEQFKAAFQAFLEMRTKSKRPATRRAQELILKDLAKHDVVTARLMLEQSIINCWRGVFPLKTERHSAGWGEGGQL